MMFREYVKKLISIIKQNIGIALFVSGFCGFCLKATAAEQQLLKVQILGSGGPELTDQRASTSYLIWINGKAKLLIDTGPGSSFHFEQTGADLNDLEAVLYTHFHVDHSNDLPAFIKAAYFTARNRDLFLYGPTGNALMPSATDFVEGLFGTRGIYRYLGEYFQPGEPGVYKIHVNNIPATDGKLHILKLPDGIKASAVSVYHGPIPALAWRLDVDGCSVTFTGDTNNFEKRLESLAQDADLLVAHHAIPENANKVALNLHMPPSMIGNIAAHAHVKKLLLSHRMKRTEGKELSTLKEIRKTYHGPIEFADDMATYRPCLN